MRFVITSAGNNSTFGDLFFSLPTEEASAHGAELVEQLCRQEDLQNLIDEMRSCGTAYSGSVTYTDDELRYMLPEHPGGHSLKKRHDP